MPFDVKKDSVLRGIGAEIRRIREDAKETQQEMADALDITTVHLSNLENGKSFPSLDLLVMFRLLYSLDPYILAALNGRANVTLHIDWNERKRREE